MAVELLVSVLQHPSGYVESTSVDLFFYAYIRRLTLTVEHFSHLLVLGRFCFVLFCFVLFCFVLFCFVLFCFVLFCFVLFCFVLFCFVLFCFVLFCFVYNDKSQIMTSCMLRPHFKHNCTIATIAIRIRFHSSFYHKEKFDS